MEVTSRDGTSIGIARSGGGQPLLLVHGTLSDRGCWWPVLRELEARFTVFAMDRRGRGESGDGPQWNLDRELEDVATVAEAIGDDVTVIGHSYGALCALGASRLTKSIGRLVLYEPPVSVDGINIISPGTVAQIERLMAEDDRGGVVETFLREVAGMPVDELKLMRRSPAWGSIVAMAHTVAREAAGRVYDTSADWLRTFRLPTLLVTGGLSLPGFRDRIDALHAVLPTSRIAELPGQQHMAISTAPQLFLRAVLEFLDS